MNTFVSTPARMRLVSSRYIDQVNTAVTASRSPLNELAPLALESTMRATPHRATTPSTIVRVGTFSRRRQAARGTTMAGASVPVNSALAMRVRRTAVKKHTRLMPNSNPAGATLRHACLSTRPDRTRSTSCHTSEAPSSRQNATTEPGDPVSFTRVDPIDSTATDKAMAMTPALRWFMPARARPDAVTATVMRRRGRWERCRPGTHRARCR